MGIAAMLTLPTVGAVASAPEATTWRSDELVEINIMRSESPNQPIKNDAPKYQAIEELLNVRLVVEGSPAASYNDKKQVLIATDDMPDIMFVGLSDVREYARDDMFVNLSEREEEMPNLFKVLGSNPNYAMLTVDGDFYHAPTIQRPETVGRLSGQLVNVRVDLLDKYDIETPTTFDEFAEAVALILENEPGMIGVTNRNGGSVTGTRKVMDCMAYPLGSGADMYYDQDLGGQWIYGPAHENFKEVLTYLNRLYNEGTLDPDYAVMTRNLWEEKLASGEAVATFDNDGVVRNFNVALSTVDEGYRIDVIPTLTNSFGQTRNFAASRDWLSEAWVISASSEVIDASVKFLDWCFTDQGADINGFGKEGVSFDYVDGRPIIKPELLEEYVGGGNASYDIQSALGVGLLDIAPYVDTGCQMQMEVYQLGSEEAVAAYQASIDSIANDKGLREPAVNPPLTEEQTERYNELHVRVDDLVYQEIDKYITGEEPIENYDTVIAAAKEAGAAEMEEIMNEAWNAVLGK
jgi:ABC-type glycerol-3-phosphate transport system substrate-binding protein